jgi:hypothetical protein
MLILERETEPAASETMQGCEGLRRDPAGQYQRQTGHQHRQGEQVFNVRFHWLVLLLFRRVGQFVCAV